MYACIFEGFKKGCRDMCADKIEDETHIKILRGSNKRKFVDLGSMEFFFVYYCYL